MHAAMPPVETGQDRAKREFLEHFGRVKEKTVLHALGIGKKRADGRSVSKGREQECPCFLWDITDPAFCKLRKTFIYK